MTKVIARVHLVHLMNVDWAPRAANPQTKPIDFGCEFAENWQMSSTIAIVIITQPVSWYSFYRPTDGGSLSRPKHCSKGAQPVLGDPRAHCSRLHIAEAVAINTTVSGVIRTWVLSPHGLWASVSATIFEVRQQTSSTVGCCPSWNC